MPRPPILPVIDWSEVFEQSVPYDDWLGMAADDEKRAVLAKELAGQELDATVASFLTALPKPVHVVAIAEAWCGDVIRHVPVLQKLAQASAQVRVRYIAREDRPDVFGRFLTNGGEAIPKFVFLSEDFVECANWGPMPQACRELISRGKACGDVGAARKLVAAAYESDAGKAVVAQELAQCIDVAASTSPEPADSPLARLTRYSA